MPIKHNRKYSSARPFVDLSYFKLYTMSALLLIFHIGIAAQLRINIIV